MWIVNIVDIPGHESDAAIRYRILRHIRSALLAADDVGEQSRDFDGAGDNTNYLFRHGFPSEPDTVRVN